MPKPIVLPTSPPPLPNSIWRLYRNPDSMLQGLALAWTFLALCFPLYDTDFWWHLRTGELIAAQAEVPSVDWYTFMDSERPWVDLHWGFQLLIAALYHLGGPTLVILVKATTITAAVAIAFRATGNTLPMAMKVMLWFPAMVAITGRGYERPEMLSQLFLAIWLWVLPQLEKRPRLIWVLPLVQVMWINCHALFILGLVVGACYVSDRIARSLANGRWGLEPAPLEPDPMLLMWAGLAALLAALLNPYFEAGAIFPLELYRKFSVEQDFYSTRIGEFNKPFSFLLLHGGRAFRSIYFDAQLTLWLLAAFSFVWLGIKRRRWSVMRVLLFAGFSHLAWEATRNTNIFALVATAVMCANFGDAWSHQMQVVRRSPRLTFAVAGFFVCLSLLVITGVWNVLGERNKPFGFGEFPNWYIHRACLFTTQPGFPNHAFVANHGQASVYIYHTAPYRRVFMDARLEVCSRQTFELYEKILGQMAEGTPDWVQAMKRDDQGRLPVVILDATLSKSAIRGMQQIRGWRLVYADMAAAVFLDEVEAQKLSLPPVSPEPLAL